MSISDLCAARFGEAAKMAAIFELRARMLADKVEALRRTALAHQLDTTLGAVIQHFCGVITADEVSTLRTAQQVRNKLLHCEFWTAKARLERAGVPVATANVSLGCFETEDVTPLAQLDPTQPRLFGWLIASAGSGELFELAEHAFTAAIMVIERLVVEADNMSPERGPILEKLERIIAKM
jgi:hypothetical protein